jgi:hypothetical protein
MLYVILKYYVGVILFWVYWKMCVLDIFYMFLKPLWIGGIWVHWVKERLSMGWITAIQFLNVAGISLCSVALHGQSSHVSCTLCRWKYTSLLFRALISVRCLRHRVIVICLRKCTIGRNHGVLWTIMWDIVGLHSRLNGPKCISLVFMRSWEEVPSSNLERSWLRV